LAAAVPICLGQAEQGFKSLPGHHILTIDWLLQLMT
jgi:hypothetical protein